MVGDFASGKRGAVTALCAHMAQLMLFPSALVLDSDLVVCREVKIPFRFNRPRIFESLAYCGKKEK